MKANFKRLLTLAVIFVTALSAKAPLALAQSRQGRVGDTMVIQYAYGDIDAFALTNDHVRGEIQNSLVNEIHRRNEIKADILQKWESLERAASHAESRNPLLRSRGNKAQMNQALLTAASKENDKALRTLSEIADFTRGKARLTAAQLKKLSGFVFVEEIKLAKRSDFARVTSRLATLDEASAVVHAADPVKPVTRFAKGMQIVRTKWGVMALGMLASVALSGYEIYSAQKAEKAESDYYLVYDDRVVAQ